MIKSQNSRNLSYPLMRTIPELHYSWNLEIGTQQSQNSIPAAVMTNKVFPTKLH